MKLKKMLCLLLALVMVMAVMTACTAKPAADDQTAEPAQSGDTANAETPANDSTAADEIVTLKILTAGDTPADLEKVQQAINDKLVADGLGINVDISYFPWSDYQDKSATMIMSGEQVDLYLVFMSTAFNNYSNRLSLDLKDLFDTYGKDIQPHISEQDLSAYTTTDGALVAVPAIYPKNGISGAMLYREDLREKYGCEPITDIDTLLAYCKVIKENETGMVPFVRLVTPLTRALGSEYDNYVNGPENSFYTVEKTADGKYVAHNMYEIGLSTYQIAKLNGEMIQNGYLPTDAAQIAPETENNWFKNGKSAILNQDLFQFTQVEDAVKQNIPGAKLAWTILNPDDGVSWAPSNNACAIASTCKNPEKAMQFINWLHADQANYDLYMYGIEGEHYTLTADGSIQLPEGVTSANNPYNATPWNFYNDQLHRASAADSELTKDAMNYWANVKVKEAIIPDFAFDPTNVTLEVGQLASVVSEIMDPMYKGSADISGWEDGLAKMKDAGIDDYLAEVQRQLDAYYGQ